jgi:hypothetical protein
MAALLVVVSACAVQAQSRFAGAEGSRTLDTTGHAKAKGLQLRIDFPASWSLEEVKRPNLVAIAVSDEGLPSRWVATVPLVARDGSGNVFPQVSYQVLFKEWLVSLVYGSGATGRAAALASFKQHETLFRLIADSMVLPQRWR